MMKLAGGLICAIFISAAFATASLDEISSAPDRTRRDSEQSDLMRLIRARCVSCNVKGQRYDGHSRFQFDDGCNRYRCVCRCNGSWDCPTRDIVDLCGQLSPSQGERQAISDTLSAPLQAIDGRCRSCVVSGREHQGHAYFTHVDGCTTIDGCICYCNGSWACPQQRARNTCAEDDLASSSATNRTSHLTAQAESNASSNISVDPPRYLYRVCQNCTAGVKVIKGNNYFDLIDGCIKMSYCTCFCNGSWTCPERFKENICESDDPPVGESRASTCRSCSVKGNTFPGNQYFQVTDGCIEYRNCICHCDGSWSCPDESRRDICLDRSDGSIDTSSCKTCTVYGDTFPGNQYFQVKHDCIEYRNCICLCNGSWSCPKDSARNVCDREGSSYSGLYGNGEADSSRSRCRTCLAYGKYFKGGNYFDVIDGCWSYRKCICRCDGSWDCNNRYIINICNNETDRSIQVKVPLKEPSDNRNISSYNQTLSLSDNQCSFCDARTKIVPGNSYFDLTDGCVELKNCLCRCDGSWECPPQLAKNICPASNQTSAPTKDVLTCANCLAKGKIVRGDTAFELTDQCTHYTSCRCHCSGQWECSEKTAQNICSTNNTVGAPDCSMCQPNEGVVHAPNTWFRLTEDCVEHTCQCFCNGSWDCSGGGSRWICQDRCLQCEVDEKLIQNNTQFVHRAGCLEYACTCHCNGSWTCSENSVRDACQPELSDECMNCNVSSSEVYEGETDFVLDQGCLQYKCRCNCDGSYFCPGKEARNTCRGEVLGGCRSCVVSETEIHKAQTSFIMRRGCLFYECTCGCDGSWECPAERARDVCLGEVPGGCRVCVISESETYRANSVFDLRRGCVSYRCRCHCDGSWSCPGNDARNICKGEVPGGCRSCILSSHEHYPGNSNFETTRNCVHYKCRCSCDGSYFCPGQTARRICQTDAVAVRSTCKECRVSSAEQFVGNSTFYLDRGCARYQCQCKCDGTYECPPERTRDICPGGRTSDVRHTECRPCVIANYTFPEKSDFKFNSGCFQFSCSCECSGRWSCDTQNPVNVCREREKAMVEDPIFSDGSSGLKIQGIASPGSARAATLATERGVSFAESDIRVQDVASLQNDTTKTFSDSNSTDSTNITASSCSPCFVDGKTLQENQEFSLTRGCFRYTSCRCYCNGRWQCAEEWNVCDVQQSSTGAHEGEVSKSVLAATSQPREEEPDVVAQDGPRASSTADVDDFYQADEGSQSKTVEEEPIQSDAAAGSEDSSREIKDPYDTCYDCQVRGVSYPERSKFILRDGCVQRLCDCHCDGSWSCSHHTDDICGA